VHLNVATLNSYTVAARDIRNCSWYFEQLRDLVRSMPTEPSNAVSGLFTATAAGLATIGGWAGLGATALRLATILSGQTTAVPPPPQDPPAARLSSCSAHANIGLDTPYDGTIYSTATARSKAKISRADYDLGNVENQRLR